MEPRLRLRHCAEGWDTGNLPLARATEPPPSSHTRRYGPRYHVDGPANSWPATAYLHHIARMRDTAEIDSSEREGILAASGFVKYEVRLDTTSSTIGMFRVVGRSGAPFAEYPVWTRTLRHRRHAASLFAWMLEKRGQWLLWGRLGEVVGPDRLLAMAASEISEFRGSQARDLLKKRAKACKAKARALKIYSFLVDHHGEFGIDLRRGGEDKGFFVMWFRQNWERERFRDWWRPQAHRFPDFAAFFEEHGGRALERKLLAEMQETEKRLKLAGLSSGGRRPLRFWRGDE